MNSATYIIGLLRSFSIKKSILLLIFIGGIFMSFIGNAQAVVPVHCPVIAMPCRTWDVALSGELGASPKRWFATKELSGGGISGYSITNIAGSFANPSIDAIFWEIARRILREFAQNIVTWIKTGQDPFFSGGTNGGLFVTNIDEFVLDAADNAAGVFLSEYIGDAYDSLCSPFRLDIGLGLGHSYGRDYGSFKYQARCTITDIVANLEDFYNDFNNGGWNAWFATSRYENTPLGLLTLSRETSRSRSSRGASANILDFSAGLGFLGLRECPPENKIPGPTQNGEDLCKNNGYVTKSPGKVIEDQLVGAINQDISQLEIADEIDEIIFALFDQLLSWTLTGGLTDYKQGSNDRPNQDDLESELCSWVSSRANGCRCSVDGNCASLYCSPSTKQCTDRTPCTAVNGRPDQCDCSINAECGSLYCSASTNKCEPLPEDTTGQCSKDTHRPNQCSCEIDSQCGSAYCSPTAQQCESLANSSTCAWVSGRPNQCACSVLGNCASLYCSPTTKTCETP